MAKKQRGKGRPKVKQPREPLASFRGSAPFADWFFRLVEFSRMPAASVIEKALILWAKEEGFEEEAPKR